MTFLRDFAKKTAKDIAYVAKDLQSMIRSHYFPDYRKCSFSQEVFNMKDD